MKQVLSIIASILFSLAYSANAELKIAIVDEQKVIESSLAYKDMTDQIEKKANAFKNTAAKIQEDLQAKYKELTSQKSVLSSDAYDKKTKEFQMDSEKAQESVYAERVNLDKAYSEATKVLEIKISEIITKKAQEMELDLVINKMTVMHNKADLDMTEIIISDLNKAMPSLAVKFEDSKLKDQSKK